MRKALITACAMGAMLACGTFASAGDLFFAKSGGPSLFARSASYQLDVPPPAPAADPYAGSVEAAPLPEGIPLFACVEYDDLDNIHPCAIKKIVMVNDPCYDPCSCCGPKCVAVCICVPPCGCVEVKVSRGGNKVKYDYGKYEVEIEVKKGYIKVDYDD